MKLGAFILQAGHHSAAWRHPSVPDAPEKNIAHFVEQAQAAERGLFDLLFLADSSAPWGPVDVEFQARTMQATNFEPVGLLSALSMATKHVGLVATSSTSFDEPYLVARKFASLDQLSGGRAGWNLVTSTNVREAFNFGQTSLPSHDDRYARAAEFADVVIGLWDSWDDGAFIRDRSTGQFFDPSKMHQLDHKGKFFAVRGPLSVSRSPQGRPIVVQAGSSEDGKQLAARTADIVFTVSQSMQRAVEFAQDVKARAKGFGRSPDQVLIMPGLVPIVGKSRAEAQAKLDELDALIPEKMGVALLSFMVGTDLSGYPLDGPLPDISEKTNLEQTRQNLVIDLAKRENLTIRQLYQKLVALRAHFTVIGTPVDIADTMEEWLTAGAADGFNITPAIMPSGLIDFVDQVVPELQRRGIYRTRYEGSNLRENLGLEKPKSRYAKS